MRGRARVPAPRTRIEFWDERVEDVMFANEARKCGFDCLT